jgi:hypothetical protein
MIFKRDSVPQFYKPNEDMDVYYSFTYNGGTGFVPGKAGTAERFESSDINKLVFKIKIPYLETSEIGMGETFGVFARSLYESNTGGLEGKFIFTYDTAGTGSREAQQPPSLETAADEVSMLEEPFVQATLIIIVLIIVAMIGLYAMKLRKERKELVAPPSFDYKYISGLQDQEQYESLYGTGTTQTQGMPPPGAPPMPPMQPGMRPGMPPPGYPPQQMPGAPQQRPGLPPGATPGASCPSCGKAIVLGMTKCPHCNAKLR